jgi:hypothetical protein
VDKPDEHHQSSGTLPEMMAKTRTTRIPLRALIQGGLGVVLVAGSVIAVAALIDESGDTHTIAVSGDDVAAGVSVNDIPMDFVEVPRSLVSLPSLTGGEMDDLATMVSNRPLRAGDVLSARDFSLPVNLDGSGMTIGFSIGEPAWLAPGQRVVLWVAPPSSENSFSAPFVLSGNVVIDSVSKDEGFAADGAFRQVNIVVAHQDVPGVIHALANQYFLYLVPES